MGTGRRGPAREGSGRKGTEGLKGSMGEYWVPASTATYCLGRGCDGDARGSAMGETREVNEDLEGRRDKGGATTRGDCRGDGAAATTAAVAAA
jgi:hypothetical protein